MSKFQQFCQMLGFHPLVGFGMFAIDWMLFGAEGITLGAGWVISIAVAIALTIPSVLIQRYGFKDEWGLAIGKGLLIGIVTAIPTALPSGIPFLGGVIGTVALVSKNRNNDTDE